MSGVKVKLRILHQPPLDEGEQLFADLNLRKSNNDDKKNVEVHYIDWTLNSHHIQNAVSIGVFKNEIHIQWLGGWSIALKNDKEKLDVLLSYMTQ